MLALIAFAIQAGFNAQYHASWQNDPNVWAPPSSVLHWYDLHQPHTLILGYQGPNPPHGGIRAETVDAYGPLVRQGGIAGYYPSDIRHAYNVNGNGAYAICVVDDGHLPTALGDFNTFSREFGLPVETSTNPTASTNRVFQVVYDNGTVPGSNVASGWGFEEALDFEWAHAMAPNAKIYVLESATGNLAFDNTIASTLPNVREVSNSWIDYGEDGPSELQLDAYFQRPGVTFYSGSGDIGAIQGYPSTSPYVVSCGGTTLNMNPAGTVVTSETGWSGSGGGPSLYEPRPAFQNDPRVALRAGPMRCDPDLSAVADPGTGVAIYSSSYGGWNVVGGTSVATPVIAGMVNASNTFYGNSQLEENLIYSLLLTSKMRDITVGESTYGTRTYDCLVGYDLVTGVGAPLDLTKPVVVYNGNLTAASSITGKNPSGGVPALESIDNVFYSITGVPFSGLGSTADVRASFVVSGQWVEPVNAAEATITVTAKANYPNIINEIFLYNAVTKNYDLLATPLLSSSEQTFTVTLTAAQAPNYIDSSGNVVVLTRALLPQNQFSGGNSAFLYSVDQVAVSYGFNENGAGAVGAPPPTGAGG